MKIDLNIKIHPNGKITFNKNALMKANLCELIQDLSNTVSLNKNPRGDLIPELQIILDKIEEEGFIIENNSINIDINSNKYQPLSITIGFNRKRPEIWWPPKQKNYINGTVSTENKWIQVKHPIRMLNPILNFLCLQKWAYDLQNEI